MITKTALIDRIHASLPIISKSKTKEAVESILTLIVGSLNIIVYLSKEALYWGKGTVRYGSGRP
jgi:hypothetical protein